MPRPPAFSHGVASCLWGVGLGLLIWGGLAALGISSATAFILAALAGIGIFFYVLIYGADTPSRPPAKDRRAAR